MSTGQAAYTGEEAEGPRSPAADYGLRDDFDPSKYDFYNPASRNARTGQRVTADPAPENSLLSSSDRHESHSPQPLSPIEELDDDSHSAHTQQKHEVDSEETPGTSVENITDRAASLHSGDFVSSKDRAGTISLEDRVELLFSRQHLQAVLADPSQGKRFAYFLRAYRPGSVPLLAYYLDVMKALKSVAYAEAIISGLDPISGFPFTAETSSVSMPWVMQDKAENTLDVLAKEDFPSFVAYHFVKIVDLALADRVTGQQDAYSRAFADGLAEVFVLSDPARPDNPIVFSSEEFHRMTGYSRQEFLGRNCRLLGGARTSGSGISRFRASLEAEREHCEVLLNYHRDGKPFINLVMCVPLRDQAGKVRYYLGAQLDITSLVNECTDLNSLRKVVEQYGKGNGEEYTATTLAEKDAFDQLSEAFNPQELEKLAVLRWQRQLAFDAEAKFEKRDFHKEREIENPFRLSSPDGTFQTSEDGGPQPLGSYQNYLLLRPGSLRILFASPDLRSPGIFQSPLMDRIGGSSRVRQDLTHALEVGRKVTAKIEWISESTPNGKTCWIHCTPLLGANDAVGVWMIILVDVEDESTLPRGLVPPNPQQESDWEDASAANTVPWSTKEIQGDDHFAYCSDSFGAKGARGGLRSRQPRISAPPEAVDPPPSTMDSRPGPGPRIAGRIYSAKDRGVNLGDVGYDDRPSSRDEHMAQRINLRPTMQTAERPSYDGNKERKFPIHMPGRSDELNETDRPAARRTYKSLSPYGLLFKD